MTFKNTDSGADIEVTRQGLKHGLSNANEPEVRAVAALPELLREAKLVRSEPDNQQRKQVKAFHHYQGVVELGGERLDIGVVVRELEDGHCYYDHFALKKQTPAGQSGSQETLATPADAGAASPAGTSGAASKDQGSGSSELGVQPTAGDGAIVPPFKRSDAQIASDAKLVGVQQLVDGITERWANPPEVIVARDMRDPSIPEQASNVNEAQKLQGATGTVHGFVHGGRVYLLADAISSPQDLLTVLAHEALGHFGLRDMFGETLTPIKQQIVAQRRKEVLAKIKAYGLDPKNKGHLLYAAEEVLAEFAQTVPQLGYVRRAVAAIRAWLRANVPGFRAFPTCVGMNRELLSFELPGSRWTAPTPRA